MEGHSARVDDREHRHGLGHFRSLRWVAGEVAFLWRNIINILFLFSGIYATYKFNNSRTLVAGLNSIQPSSKTDQEISTHTDNVFSTVIRAAERIPYDSAIFLFTNSEPVEDEVAQTAAIMLLKKRIRVSD